MEDVVARRNALAAERVVKRLQERRLEAYYAPDRARALEIALSLIPEGSTVGWGGSRSVEEIGLKDAVRAGNYRALDRDRAASPEEKAALERQAFSADAFLMGTNAITEDGQLVNIDGRGNRVAALCYGPERVIVIAGINKLTADLDAAVSRARHTAAPANALRFEGDTPCHRSGVCGDCRAGGCICNQIVITRGSMTPGRIHVILVGEALGF